MSSLEQAFTEAYFGRKDDNPTNAMQALRDAAQALNRVAQALEAIRAEVRKTQ